jgi:hypothetical protein
LLKYICTLSDFFIFCLTNITNHNLYKNSGTFLLEISGCYVLPVYILSLCLQYTTKSPLHIHLG